MTKIKNFTLSKYETVKVNEVFKQEGKEYVVIQIISVLVFGEYTEIKVIVAELIEE